MCIRDSLQTSHALHPDVHQQNVRVQRLHQFNRLFSAVAGGRHSDFTAGFQNGFQRTANQGVVVHKYNLHLSTPDVYKRQSMGIAGELAFEAAGQMGTGSFHIAIIDALSRLDAELFGKRAKFCEE